MMPLDEVDQVMVLHLVCVSHCILDPPVDLNLMLETTVTLSWQDDLEAHVGPLQLVRSPQKYRVDG